MLSSSPLKASSSSSSTTQKNTYLVPLAQTFSYHLHTLFLFIVSDVKTIVLPQTAFGIITLLSGQNLLKGSPRPPPPATTIGFCCVPLVVVWILLNLLPLDMSNQCTQESIDEDRENKPWRPIPAGRVSMQDTRHLILIGYAVALLSSLMVLGATAECVTLMIAGYVYNRLEGANKSCVARNLLNAIGYMAFAAGAARVACAHSGTELRPRSWLWFLVLGGVISTTIHFQDLYDQKGDSIRGRRTIPLVIGDGASRITICVPIAVWSFLCPAFWRSNLIGFAVPVSLGFFVIFRLYRYRSVDEDRKSFKVWNVWITALYLAPFFAAAS